MSSAVICPKMVVKNSNIVPRLVKLPGVSGLLASALELLAIPMGSYSNRDKQTCL